MKDRLKAHFADEETLLAVAIAWTVGILFFTLGAFYMGNIMAVPPPHEGDITPAVMVTSFKWALGGLGLGVLFAAVFTVVYPRFTRRDYDHDMHAFRHGHGHGHSADHEAEPHHAS